MEDRIVSKQTGNESESTSSGHEICTCVDQPVGQGKAGRGVKNETQLKCEEQKNINNVPIRQG